MLRLAPRTRRQLPFLARRRVGTYTEGSPVAQADRFYAFARGVPTYAVESDLARCFDRMGIKPSMLYATYRDDLVHDLGWVVEFDRKDDYDRLFGSGTSRSILMGKVAIRLMALTDEDRVNDLLGRHKEIQDDNGCIVLLRGAPLSSRASHVYRFLQDYALHADMPIQRVGTPVKIPDNATFVIRFATTEEAERCCREKHGAPLGHTFVHLFHLK